MAVKKRYPLMKYVKRLADGFTCACKRYNKFPAYVYAHFHDELSFTCECGRSYTVWNGTVEEK